MIKSVCYDAALSLVHGGVRSLIEEAIGEWMLTRGKAQNESGVESVCLYRPYQLLRYSFRRRLDRVERDQEEERGVQIYPTTQVFLINFDSTLPLSTPESGKLHNIRFFLFSYPSSTDGE